MPRRAMSTIRRGGTPLLELVVGRGDAFETQIDFSLAAMMSRVREATPEEFEFRNSGFATRDGLLKGGIVEFGETV